jgi:hypothetical protein
LLELGPEPLISAQKFIEPNHNGEMRRGRHLGGAGTVQPHLAKSKCCAAQACVQRSMQWSQDNHCVTPIAIVLGATACIAALKNLSSMGCPLRLAALSLHVRADAVTREAATAAAADAAPMRSRHRC